MEKNANANANPNTNANANAISETSPDQHRGGERSRNNENNPNPTVIELSSSFATAPVSATTADSISRGQTVDHVMRNVGTSSSHEQVRGSSEVEQGKKRERGDGGSSEQEQQVKAAKKKGELTEVPKGEPRCATCNKVFKSWKALFGHLRSHPERTYRGALPPPTVAELDIRRCQQQLASTLLTVAQEVAASTRRGLDIDLNQPSTADDGGSPENTGGVGFDLNAEPPQDSDGED